MVIVMPAMLAVICVLEVAVGVIGGLVSLMAIFSVVLIAAVLRLRMAVPVLVMLMGMMRMHMVLGLRFVHRLVIPFVLIHNRSSWSDG